MFAAIHARKCSSHSNLANLAHYFSPRYEQSSPESVVFEISSLKRLIGGPSNIAAAISQRGSQLGIEANLAIAANPDTALLAARFFIGVTLIDRGDEPRILAPIPLNVVVDDQDLLVTLERWGITTLGQLADLPPIGIQERLGVKGKHLHRVALGVSDRPLKFAREPHDYSASTSFDEPLDTLEQILFVISPMLHDLLRKLAADGLATKGTELRFGLGRNVESLRSIELPIPTRSAAVLLKQIQLDLETHPLNGAAHLVELALIPSEPRTLQRGLYVPTGPEPDRLQNVLARVAALVGQDNVGSPVILDTHRPDAFVICPFAIAPNEAEDETTTFPFQLALRIYRPPLAARIKLEADRPIWVAASTIEGAIAVSAGPWRTSGDWWTDTVWSRDEWDVGLENGGIYRIYLDRLRRSWFVGAMYD